MHGVLKMQKILNWFFRYKRLAKRLADESSWCLLILSKYNPDELDENHKLLELLAEAYDLGLPVNAAIMKILRDRKIIQDN